MVLVLLMSYKIPNYIWSETTTSSPCQPLRLPRGVYINSFEITLRLIMVVSNEIFAGCKWTLWVFYTNMLTLIVVLTPESQTLQGK
jgi:hypothetical protein